MPVRTGTASSVLASAVSGSTSVTVPADATGVVAFFCHYQSGAGGSMSTLTLGGTAIPILIQQADGAVANEDAIGVGFLGTLPGTGPQTLAWAYSAGGTRTEGGELILVWVKSVDKNTPWRDAQIASEINNVIPSFSLATNITDLVIVYAKNFQSGSTFPTITGVTTAFINDTNVGVSGTHCIDVGEVAPGASSTTITMTSSPDENFNGLAAISLIEVSSVEPISAKQSNPILVL